MLKKRIIPILLLKNKGLVKGVKFSDYRYIGDPMNAIKVFNDKEVDELIFLDIEATSENRVIDVDFVKKVADECYMPFTVGGGIVNIQQMRDVLKMGAEKISINTSSLKNPNLIREASESFGSQSVVVSIDVDKGWSGKHMVVSHCGKKKTKLHPVEWAKSVEELGAGEILLNLVYRDGTMNGYDVDFIKYFISELSIPVIVCGGAGRYEDIMTLFEKSKVSAAAAGSLFVFHNKQKAVLINYPSNGNKTRLIDYV